MLSRRFLLAAYALLWFVAGGARSLLAAQPQLDFVACYYVNVIVQDWHEFTDESVVVNYLSQGRDAFISRCNVGDDSIRVDITASNAWPNPVIVGTCYRSSSQCNVESNTTSTLIQNEANQQAQDAQRKREQAARERAAIEAAEKIEKQKQAALADCGTEPGISGGPWFSST